MKKLSALALVIIALTGCWTTAEGTKVGIITKLAKEGAFIGTWEGSLIRGGLSSGSGAMGASFNFTVESKDVLNTLQQAMDKNQEVKVYYHKEEITWARSESNNYFVDRVEIITK